MAGRFKFENGYVFPSGIKLIKRVGKNKSGEWKGKFVCPFCGKNFITTIHSISSDKTKSCGCLTKNRYEELGKRFETNFVDKKFGKLYVISKTTRRSKDKRILYLCKCDCGNFCLVSSHSLSSGHTKSCGCLRDEIGKYFIKDFTGRQFGFLEVIKDSGKRKKTKNGSNVIWLCRCLKCGNYKEVSGGDLQSGRVSSCGCLMAGTSSQWSLKIEQILKENDIKYETEKIFPECRNPKTNYKLRFDFYLPDYNCCIEYDGEQHFIVKGGWNTEENLEATQYRDNIKDNFCKDNNIKLIRIPYTENKKICYEYLIDLLNK